MYQFQIDAGFEREKQHCVSSLQKSVFTVFFIMVSIVTFLRLCVSRQF